MSSNKVAEVVIRYDGKTAKDGRLNLFDASESLKGITRVVNIITHAFVNKDEIRERLTTPVGAVAYLSAAKKGCFEESIEIDFCEEVVNRIKPTVIISNFWDYFACCISSAVGRNYEPTTPMVRKIFDRDEVFFEEIAVELEAPLRLLHRPIASAGAETITFARPKSGDVLTLDIDTCAYVSEWEQATKVSHWTGNVTKYNSLSGYGRMYIDQFKGTVPFRIDQFLNNERAHKAAAASMNEWVKDQGGKRKLLGYDVRSSKGAIKRIVIQEINPMI